MEDRLRPSASRLHAPPLSARSVRDSGTPSILPHRHALWVSPPPAPEAGNSCPTTSGSRSCTDCFFRSCLELLMDCPSTPGRALVGLDPLVRLPHQPLGNIKRLVLQTSTCSPVSSRTSPGCSREQTHDEPAPSLHPHYRGFTTTTSRSASVRRIGTQRLAVSAARRSPSRPPAHSTRHGIDARLPTFRARAADQDSRRLHAGHHLASKTGTRQAHPGAIRRPGFDAI